MMTSTFRQSLDNLAAAVRPTVVLVAFLTAAVSLGCGEEEKVAAPSVHQFDLQVSVVDTNDNAVAKAPVLLDGKPVGYTDRDGLFKATINEREGAAVELGVGKMDDYLVPDDAVTSATLRLSKTLEGDRQPVPVELNTVVQSARQDYLVWVDLDCGKYLDNAKCQNVAVMYNGEEVARTDDEGKAHFAFDGVPSEKATFSLDTPTYQPTADDDEDDTFVMKPVDPSYEVELGLDTEVFRISQEFNDPIAAEKAKKRAKRRKRYQRRRRKATKAKKKKEKKKSDVIELW